MVLASSSTVVMQDESFPACKIEFELVFYLELSIHSSFISNRLGLDGLLHPQPPSATIYSLYSNPQIQQNPSAVKGLYYKLWS